MLQFALLLWGLTYLWTGSVVMAVPRQLWYEIAPGPAKALAYCPACAGGWIGAALACLGAWPFEDPVLGWGAVDALVASSGMMAMLAYWVPLANNAWAIEQNGGKHDEAPQS